jgi:CDP-glycerol glycerophosphotransferase
MKSFLKNLVSLLIRVTPKRRYCYLKAMPSFEDSMVVIYSQLPLDQFDKIIWSVYDKNDAPPFEDRGKTAYVKKGSIRDFYYGVISKTIFTTHGHFIPNIPSNQVCINIWHGMPLKAMGLLNDQPGRQDSYLCSTSAQYQDIMSRTLGMPLERTLVTGIPRNDLLKLDDSAEIWAKAGIDQSKYDKVFFWLPTYRKSVLGYFTEDGVEVDNVFNMVDFPTEKFHAFLEKNRCLCILKPHPMAPKKDMRSTDHILLIDEKWLWERKLTLYPLVGLADFLVSDISSIMIDYMLLDRPMIVCFEDAEQYQQSRNVVFDPIEDYLPGEIVDNYDDLTRAISTCIAGGDPAKEKRESLKKQFHQDTDFNATQRLLDVVLKS